MNSQKMEKRIALSAGLLALTMLSGLAMSQSRGETGSSDTQANTNAPTPSREATAAKHVDAAVTTVQRMDREPRMKELLQQAKGVFIVPTYGRAALGIGAGGGSGVLMVKRDDGSWSDPAFYNIGGINIGAQAGAEGGPIAMVLNNEKAVSKFMEKNNFSLSADAGLTVVNWAKMAQGSVGRGDVVVWSGTKGLFGNVVTIGVNDIRFNQNLTNSYYHQTASAEEVINGKLTNPQADKLKRTLASSSSGSASSTSGDGSSTGKSSGNK